jgi:hypothetical protein
MNKSRKPKEPVLGKSKIREYAVVAGWIFLITHASNFLGDGFGVSRVSGYWDYYNGNMSYTEIPARITVKEIIESPTERYSWEVLQFGCKLDKQQEIIADVHAAGIPVEQIQTLFYNRSSFNAPLEVGKTYFVELDIHANAYSFLFKRQYAFGIFSWQELGPGEIGPVIEPYAWKGKLMLYALACFIQTGLFLSIIFFTYDSRTGPRAEIKFTLVLATLFTAATLWIGYVNQPFYRSGIDYILPGIALTVGLGSIIWCSILFLKSDPTEDTIS